MKLKRKLTAKEKNLIEKTVKEQIKIIALENLPIENKTITI